MLSAEYAPTIAGFKAASHWGAWNPSSSAEEMRYATQLGSIRSPGSKSAPGEAPKALTMGARGPVTRDRPITS